MKKFFSFKKNHSNSHLFLIAKYYSSKSIDSPSNVASYFPYGDNDFAQIRMSKQFFVDNTLSIKKVLEGTKHMTVLKPSRFGKSLWLSIIANFVDIMNKGERFKNLFDGLEIMNHKEELKEHISSYYVLELDLSVQPVGIITERVFDQRFHNNINASILEFCKKYQIDSNLINPSDALTSLDIVTSKVQFKEKNNLIILVDEYDRFTNKVMLDPNSKIASLIETQKQTKREYLFPGSIVLRSFYEKLKSLKGFHKYKTLTTGIFPIAMADASGWNVCKDFSGLSDFGNTFGFKKGDIERALNDIGIIDVKDRQKILLFMETHFDGYRFEYSTENLYNPQLCLHFLQSLLSVPNFKEEILNLKNVKDIGSSKVITQNWLDPNVVNTSKSFLEMISKFPETSNVLQTLLKCKMANDDIANGPISNNLQNKLSSENGESNSMIKTIDFESSKKYGISFVDDVAKKQKTKSGEFFISTDRNKQIQNILSLMYSYGAVTRLDQGIDPILEEYTLLGIPNMIVFNPIKDHYTETYKEIELINDFISKPEKETLKRLFTYLADQEKLDMDNKYNEATIHSFIYGRLKLFQDLRIIDYKVHSNGSFKNPQRKDSDGLYDFRFDLVIETSTHLLFIELKRLRPNAVMVKYPNKLQKDPIRFVGNFTKVDWGKSVLKKQQEILDKMENEEDEEIPIPKILTLKTHYTNANQAIKMVRNENGEEVNNPKICETVQEVLQYACNQGTFYHKQVIKSGYKIGEEDKATPEELEARKKKTALIFGAVNISRHTFVIESLEFNTEK